MNDYQKLLEEFRMHYMLNYGLQLDDEVLFFFIRVNEMHNDVKKELKTMQVNVDKRLDVLPRIVFRSGWDYFMFGMGKPTIPCLIVSIALALTLIISSLGTGVNNVIFKNGRPSIAVKINDSCYFLPLKSAYDFK